MTPESANAQRLRERASQWLMRLFRNNRGRLPNPKSKQWVWFGLGHENKKSEENLSSDYIGFMPITITPEMVGKTIPVFTSIEAKTENFVEKESYPKYVGVKKKIINPLWGQKNWIDMVKFFNGIAGFASKPEHIDEMVQEFFLRMKQNDKN